jgi:N-acetylglucosamine-6-phosphate deacetylase
VLSALSAAPPSTTPPDGLRVNTPRVHALTNARVQITPEKVLERGTVVFRDGRIIAVGRDAEIPADAKIWDLAGKTVYAGFIDAYNEQPIDLTPKPAGAPYWNSRVRPQLEVSRHLAVDAKKNEALRSQGIVAQLVAPAGGIIDGACALVSTGEEGASRTLLADRGPLHLRLTVRRGPNRDEYPSSPMGAVALARQAMLDAQWYDKAWKAHAASQVVPRPERNDALAALQGVLAGQRSVIIDSTNEWYFLRAYRFAEEFKLSAVILGSGREYRRIDDIAATGRTVIVPLDFPQPPSVTTAESAMDVSLASLMHWDIAPENPSRLAAAGVPIAFTANGLKDIKDFLPRLRTAVERGLSREKALAALTTTPAKICGAADELGSVEPGKLAYLIVADGDLFTKKSKIERVFIEGQPFNVDAPKSLEVTGTWEVSLARAEGDAIKATLVLSGNEKLSGKLQYKGKADAAEEISLTNVGQREGRVSLAFDAEKLGMSGIARLTAIVTVESESDATLAGHITWGDGSRSEATGKRTKKAEPPKDEEKKEKKVDRAASFAVNFPLGAYGLDKRPEQPKTLLLTHATIWTSAEQGILKDASILIESGKITAVGEGIEAPAGATIVDCKGKHITPGIIDCHSHMATDGGINEVGQAITAEVRIGDFIDPSDIDIYRQLAGGVTTINVLHGSANPMGGQNQVCKLRWGEIDAAMKFADAPPGIKFALGENVKQSNWGERYTSRYPQTRMGVEQLMRDEFLAARKYILDHANPRADQLPPRRDLELEAIAEILQGKRWIHCHSYRQDEILALLKLCDEFQIQIATLQHILEGYKIADEIAKRKIGASAFSDWWAYKVEVIDAIPYNGPMMHKLGIVVSFNSDDRELARHLNHEAAKAVKYGGLAPAEALKFVTLNPAKQLRIDKWVGSLEPGKDADIAIWSGDPLAITSRCEQTWVDGRKYFDLDDDKKHRATAKQRHAALVQKILQSGDAMLSPDEHEPEESELWPRYDEFCAHGEAKNGR